MQFVDFDGQPITMAQWMLLLPPAAQQIEVVLASDEWDSPIDGQHRTLRTIYIGVIVPELGITPFGTGIKVGDNPWVAVSRAATTKTEALAEHRRLHAGFTSPIVSD